MASEYYETVGSSVSTSTSLKKRSEVEIKVTDEVDYSIRLKPRANHKLTPLNIPDFDEISSGTSINKEAICFQIHNHKQPADSLLIEVIDGTSILYKEEGSNDLLSDGQHDWEWDGYDNNGILDTKLLKSKDLLIRLTAKKGSTEKVKELKLANEHAEVDWVDARIDRKTSHIDIIVRPSFSDGGESGKNPSLVPLTYTDLESLAKTGIEHFWSRNGSRGFGVGAGIVTAKGQFAVTVKADINSKPSASNFKLVESLDSDFNRSTSLALFRKISHNHGYWFNQLVTLQKQPGNISFAKNRAKKEFEETSAHEFGHLILNEYGDEVGIPGYSWSHKNTSTTITQKPLDNNPSPTSGEVDVMHYFSSYPQSFDDRWRRTVASEQDVKGLVWLTRIVFSEKVTNSEDR